MDRPLLPVDTFRLSRTGDQAIKAGANRSRGQTGSVYNFLPKDSLRERKRKSHRCIGRLSSRAILRRTPDGRGARQTPKTCDAKPSDLRQHHGPTLDDENECGFPKP